MLDRHARSFRHCFSRTLVEYVISPEAFYCTARPLWGVRFHLSKRHPSLPIMISLPSFPTCLPKLERSPGRSTRFSALHLRSLWSSQALHRIPSSPADSNWTTGMQHMSPGSSAALRGSSSYGPSSHDWGRDRALCGMLSVETYLGFRRQSTTASCRDREVRRVRSD